MGPVLAVETSCDDTSAAVLNQDGGVLSSEVSSQVATHARYGGVVPELASREHLTNLPAVVDAALRRAGVGFRDLSAVAVTAGPGLLGSVLVGLSYAKGVALALGLPLAPVNHIEAHLTSPWLEHPQTPFPALALVVSGGHSHLFLMRSRSELRLVAATRDDAAGEALDKVAKRMGLPYPGGPVLDRLYPLGDPGAVLFPLPKMGGGSLDFSFSGLKTAFLHRLAQEGLVPDLSAEPESRPQRELDLLASFHRRVVDHLIQRTRRALLLHRPASLVMAGGVACNRLLRRRLSELAGEFSLPCAFPAPAYCTDNAAMVGFNALPRIREGRASTALDEDASVTVRWESLRTRPEGAWAAHR